MRADGGLGYCGDLSTRSTSRSAQLSREQGVEEVCLVDKTRSTATAQAT